jgi:hypothetical protein
MVVHKIIKKIAIMMVKLTLHQIVGKTVNLPHWECVSGHKNTIMTKP